MSPLAEALTRQLTDQPAPVSGTAGPLAGTESGPLAGQPGDHPLSSIDWVAIDPAMCAE